MCLSVPRKIVKIDGDTALLQDKRWVKLDLVPGIKEGDYVIVSADMAVEKISEVEAREMSELIHEA